MNCKVSIIMGVFNSEKTIRECIDSILNQTYKNIEFVICDDNSIDNTYSILKQYQQKNSNIVVIKNNENKGLAYSLNRCLKNCSKDSKYIARMDGDDICIETRIEKQVSFLNTHDGYDVVGTARYLDDGTGSMKITNVKETPQKEDLKVGSPFAHPTIMIKKECLEKLNGYQVLNRTRRGQDLDLWFRFYANGYKGFNLKEPLLIYHEDLKDYKKRTFKTAWMYFRTNLYGYRLLKFPLYTYAYAFKPLISAILPNRIMMKYHRKEK